MHVDTLRGETGAALRAFFDELSAAGVQYALLRVAPDAAECDAGERSLLVSPADLERLEAIALRHDIPHRRAHETAGERVDGPRVVTHTRLYYGGAGGWLSTGHPDRLVLARAVTSRGVRRLAAPDELIDTLLHCLLDLGRVPEPYRRRLTRILEELRADPAAAGRAAERVQAELAPVLTWDALLADIVRGRWDALLARRSRVRLHLLARKPARSVRRFGCIVKARVRSGRPFARTGHVPSPFVDASADAPPRAGAGSTTEARAEPHAEPRAGPPAEPPPAEVRAAPEGGADPDATDRLNRRQIRGSGLLLAGRGLATGIKFFAELLVVRYLSTAAYGSWTWALSALLLLEVFAVMGLNRAVPRFVPVHLERKERDELIGVLAFVLGSLVVTCTLMVVAFYAVPEWVAGLAGASPGQSLDVLFIVIFLLPVEAVGNFFTTVCAAFGNSQAIFFRRYVLNPGLRLAIALVLVALQADVRLLAYGWLVSGLLGLAYYSVTVFEELRKRGLLAGGIRGSIVLPVRRVLSYTIPVMGADWFRAFMITPAPLLLGYFTDMSTVALYQVVIPLVALNTQASQSFVMLYEPAASRVLARGDRGGLEKLYWRSAAWVAVLSFPGFALSFAAAEPLTLLLYGERYAAAAPILSVLAVGTFIDVAAGFNDSTLRVSGNVRWLMAVNVFGALLNVALNLLLIPPYGALGAGMATGSAMLVYAVLKQICLRRATGVRMMHPSYARTYLVMGGLGVALAAVRMLWSDRLEILAVALLTALLLVGLHARGSLAITETFPELARWPWVKRLLG